MENPLIIGQKKNGADVSDMASLPFLVSKIAAAFHYRPFVIVNWQRLRNSSYANSSHFWGRDEFDLNEVSGNHGP